YKNNTNTYRLDILKYKIRDKVLLNTENLNTGRPYAKLIPLFEGPFEILKINSYRGIEYLR
ncbi:hypothetical protein NEUTE2DRAFT_70895, partial [Neurospora tetrasperma FGSC 2509]